MNVKQLKEAIKDVDDDKTVFLNGSTRDIVDTFESIKRVNEQLIKCLNIVNDFDYIPNHEA